MFGYHMVEERDNYSGHVKPTARGKEVPGFVSS